MQNFLQTLRIRPFLFLWISELFSQIAMNMLNFILILLAFSLTNSNTAVSGIVLSFTIPAIFFGIIAGVYVDRWNKKHVLTIANVVRLLILFVLAFFHNSLPMLYVAAFFVAIATQFFIPAETPLIPLIVEKKYLLSANALFSVAWFGSVFVAYALSGPFLLFFGFTNSLFFLSLSFLIAAVFSIFIRLNIKPTSKKMLLEKKSIILEIKNAFSVIIKTQEIYHAFLMLAFSQILTLIIAVIGPGFAKNVLGMPVNQFPIFFVTPTVIGMGVGAYAMANYFNRFSRHKSANLGLFLGSIVILILPYSTRQTVAIFAFLLGLANAFIFVPSNTLIQEHTTDEFRGKIYGTLNSASAVISLIPVIAAGSLADLFGIKNVLTALGGIIGLIGVFRLWL